VCIVEAIQAGGDLNIALKRIPRRKPPRQGLVIPRPQMDQPAGIVELAGEAIICLSRSNGLTGPAVGIIVSGKGDFPTAVRKLPYAIGGIFGC
jgi:hypothetical protein